jgi:hypothetical protein
MLQSREQCLAPAENRTPIVRPVARPYADRAIPDPYHCVLSYRNQESIKPTLFILRK